MSIFYSYAQEDEKLRQQLETHLSLLRQQKLITEWHDRRIDVGKDWKQTIDTHLMKASVILLLISPDFLASDYCYSVEMRQALERHQKNEAWVIPILLRPTDWEDAPFAYLQYLPRNRRAVTQWRNRDEAFVEVAKSLRAIVTGAYSPLDTSPDLSASLKSPAFPLSQQEDHFNRTIPSDISNESMATMHQLTYPLQQRSLNILAWLINLFAIVVLFTVLRFIPSLAFIPLIGYVQQHRLPFLILSCGMILLSLIGSLITRRLIAQKRCLPLRRYYHSWSLVGSTSTISFILCFFLLITILLQPSWCPSTLCYPSSIASGAVTKPQGIHDANLEAYFLTFESNAVVIPGDPAHISPGDVSNEMSSHTIGAVPTSVAPTKNSQLSSAYRVVLVVHSLYQGRYSILIDQVALTVIDRPVIPQPLNVWENKSLVYYDTSRYGIVYDGEGLGIVLPARYLASPYGYIQLIRDEADQLNIQISSQVPVDLKFKIQVTYHIATEAKISLQIPEVFEVVFADQSNWYPYQLQSGHFVPTR